ncbi:MAG: hypothetical protein IJ849_08195 [Selenomonadaceae bacterium]|nr:hypothetical protein [Selenomonadaceae bacterium]
MRKKKTYTCRACGKSPLTKDEVGVSKKLLDGEALFCLPCLAAYLEVAEQDLLDKIEEFKEQGCELFA